MENKLTNSQIRTEALATLKGNWGMGALFTLIYIVISAFTAVPFIQIVSLLITIPVLYGFAIGFLQLSRTRQMNVPMMFEAFSDFGRIFITCLLTYIYIFLWTLLLVVPGIIKSYSYAMVPYILKDEPNCSYNAVIDRSSEMMKGYKMKLFLLDLSFIGWVLLSLITFGIGLLFVIPYIYTARAIFYEELKRTQVFV